MFARYFKQVYKFPLHKTPTRNISFLKNLLKKPTEETPQPTQAAQSSFTNENAQTFKTSEVPPPTENTTTTTEKPFDLNKMEEAFKSEHGLTEQAETAQKDMFPEIPKTRGQLLQEKVDDELDLPYKLYGNQAKVEYKSGYMGDRIFSYHKVPKDFVTNHFNKIYSGVLYSIAARDEEFLSEYLEKNFSERLLASLTNLSKQGYMIKAVQDVGGIRGEPIVQKTDIADIVLVKGLNVDRDTNKDESAYHKFIDIEDMGMVIYTPLEVTDPNNFVDPKQNQQMYDHHAKVIMRILVEVQSPLKLVILRPNGEQIEIDNNENSHKHTVIFETQMKAPPKFTSSYKLENYMEWLGKFKFGVWKMVDMDNWMLGNPLLINQTTRSKYQDKIFKGSKYDVESVIDLKKM